jgi:serine/threonine-protein kinase haspin
VSQNLETRKIEAGHSNINQPLKERTRTSILKLEMELSERLQLVLVLLDLKEGDENLTCAGDLVAFAIGSQWLQESDFLC